MQFGLNKDMIYFYKVTICPRIDFLLRTYYVAIGTKWDTVAYFVALESPDSIPVSYCAQQSSPVALTTSFYPSGYNAM